MLRIIILTYIKCKNIKVEYLFNVYGFTIIRLINVYACIYFSNPSSFSMITNASGSQHEHNYGKNTTYNKVFHFVWFKYKNVT